MLVYTLKRAAGEVSFAPDKTIDLPQPLVERLLADGAVRIISPSPPIVTEQQVARKPKGKAKANDGTDSDS